LELKSLSWSRLSFCILSSSSSLTPLDTYTLSTSSPLDTL
jgi:hypothetical protein